MAEGRFARPIASRARGITGKLVQYVTFSHKDRGDGSRLGSHNFAEDGTVEDILYGRSAPHPYVTELEASGDIYNAQQYPPTPQIREVPGPLILDKSQLPPSPVYTTQSDRVGVAPLQLDEPDLTRSLQMLKDYHTAILVDDSESMQIYRQVVHQLLHELLPLVIRSSEKPVEIQLLSSEKKPHGREYFSTPSFGELWNGAKSNANTSLQVGLLRIIGPKIQNLKRHATVNVAKGLNVICITDGNQSDKKAIANYIQRVAEKLDDKGAQDTLIGVQFLQVGDSQHGTDFLNHLDNNLKGIDIVDTVPYAPSPGGLKPRVKVKMILGAIHKSLDDDSDDNE
ncbi:hypothetical protein TWF481_010228 [Arthrobotrys musiformis]|uniref:VWFA domain-containing protein n=1 Tax=Arthrobotrys musiformis TaxID=47236 RepID=A0AAV9W081_9PEZI